MLVAIIVVVIIQQSLSARPEASDSEGPPIVTTDKSQTVNLVESPSATVVHVTDSTFNIGQRSSDFGHQISEAFGGNPVKGGFTVISSRQSYAPSLKEKACFA